MGYRVLLVDDDIDLLPSMIAMLQELSDLTVDGAEDGLQGLQKVYELRPDCVVVDVRMPELNGYQLVQALRGDPATASIPIVILSALNQDKDAYIGLAVGSDRYMTKPVEADELIAVIGEVCRLGAPDRLAQMHDLMNRQLPAGEDAQ